MTFVRLTLKFVAPRKNHSLIITMTAANSQCFSLIDLFFHVISVSWLSISKFISFSKGKDTVKSRTATHNENNRINDASFTHSTLRNINNKLNSQSMHCLPLSSALCLPLRPCVGPGVFVWGIESVMDFFTYLLEDRFAAFHPLGQTFNKQHHIHCPPPQRKPNGTLVNIRNVLSHGLSLYGREELRSQRRFQIKCAWLFSQFLHLGRYRVSHSTFCCTWKAKLGHAWNLSTTHRLFN